MTYFKNHILRVFVLFSLLASALAIAVTNQGFMDFDGKVRQLDEYTQNNKWTVVMFWASDCHVCNAESQQYVDFYQRHQAENIQVVGVSMDGYAGKAAAEGFVERNGITFPNLIIDSQSGADYYTDNTGEAWIGTPSFMIYKPTGELAAAQVGAVPPALIEAYISKNSL
ncbi:MAG: redoxin domain-containing protein [Gammaproteobacteria bacterium]